MANITVQSTFFKLAFLLFLFPPRVEIDGGPAQQLKWGTSTIEVTPGQHQVFLYTKYLWVTKAAKAKVDVTVQEGQTVTVKYKAPTWYVWARGKVAVA